MTPDERKLVVEYMRKYPAGVPNDAWGYGPMAKDRHPIDGPVPPYHFDRDTLLQYG